MWAVAVFLLVCSQFCCVFLAVFVFVSAADGSCVSWPGGSRCFFLGAVLFRLNGVVRH